MPPYDVQCYVIVSGVSVMAVALPLARVDMYLDVSGCCLAVDGEDSILKIAAGGVAASARVDYVNLLATVGSQFCNQLVLPDTGNQLFCNLCFHLICTRLRVVLGKKLSWVRWCPSSFFVDFTPPALFVPSAYI
jgi:hypothetical protein